MKEFVHALKQAHVSSAIAYMAQSHAICVVDIALDSVGIAYAVFKGAHIRGTMAELCAQFEVHANQIGEWKKQLVSRATEVFGGAGVAESVDLDPLHAKIGQLALENDSLRGARSPKRDC